LAKTKKKSNAAAATKSDAIRAIIAAQPKATLQEIKTHLQKSGVKASDALVNKIKYGRMSANGKKSTRSRKRASGTSKADAIRGMFAELGRHARPRDVIAALKVRGVAVTSAQVSMLRRKLSRRGASRTDTAGAVSLDHLLAAKNLAARVGGIERARKALDSLAKLVEA
jgi:hypothetical protein